MSTPYLGQIIMFAGNFAPKNYAFCNGQIVSVQQYTALFSLIGTYYGGNGTTTFGFPNLQSQLPVHQGTGSGLSTYVIGESGGSSTVSLTLGELAAHNHPFNATATTATASAVGANLLPGQPTGGNPAHFYASQGQGQPALNYFPMAAGVCGVAGSGTAHANMMPSLCISFVIALVGIFPSRN